MDDHAFRWPDEDPAPKGARESIRDTVSRTARALAIAQRPARRQRRWRLGAMVRTRPLPLALWLAIGLGPFAWAVRGLDVGSALSRTAPPGSTEAHGERVAPAAPPAGAQWGEPLPQFRHLFEADPGAQRGPALPPSIARSLSGSVVLASEYFAARRAREAAGDETDVDVARSATRTAGARAPAAGAVAAPEAGPAGSAWVTATRADQTGRAVPPGPSRPLGMEELVEMLRLSRIVDMVDPAEAAAAPAAVLTLPAAVERGLRHSRDVQSARARFDAFRELSRSPVSVDWPDSGAAMRWATDRTSWRSGPESSAVDRDRALLTAADIVWQAKSSEVAAQVARAYLQALQAHTALTLALEHERELRHLLGVRATRGKRDAARGAEIALLRLNAARARARVADARVVHEASRDHLASLIGAQPRWLVLELPPGWRAPLDLRGAIAEASEHNLALRASHSELTALAFEAWGAAAAAASVPPEAPGSARAAAPREQQAPARRRSMTAPARGPFDDGGPLLQPAAEKLQRIATTQAQVEELQRNIDRDLQSAYATLDAIDGRHTQLRQQSSALRHQVFSARARLMAGQAPAQELVDAYAQQQRWRAEIASLLLEEALQHLRIAQLTGRLPAHGSTVVAAR